MFNCQKNAGRYKQVVFFLCGLLTQLHNERLLTEINLSTTQDTRPHFFSYEQLEKVFF
jgi:hypothetical protein